jgi:hypothetical protein
MLYGVLVVSNGGGGKRFTTERDAPLSVGDTFEQDVGLSCRKGRSSRGTPNSNPWLAGRQLAAGIRRPSPGSPDYCLCSAGNQVLEQSGS